MLRSLIVDYLFGSIAHFDIIYSIYINVTPFRRTMVHALRDERAEAQVISDSKQQVDDFVGKLTFQNH
jgi:phosphate starvation-inducible membrane PsiE